ncbi:MAG: hypothetical protein L0H84_16695 [Pseudonocardia sp.]|nr:hypothetical protein [Pseudonocardia sp.]
MRVIALVAVLLGWLAAFQYSVFIMDGAIEHRDARPDTRRIRRDHPQRRDRRAASTSRPRCRS